MTVLVGLDVGTTGVKAIAISPDGEVLAGPRRAIRSRRRARAGRSRIRRTGGARPRRRSRGSASPRSGSGSRARCTGSSRSTSVTGSCGPRSSGTTSAPVPSARRSRSGRPRAADRADRQPRADRVHGAEAPLAAHATSPTSTRASAGSCSRRTTCVFDSPASTRSTRRMPRARCSSTSRARRWSDEVLRRARASRASGCRRLPSRPDVAAAPATRRRRRSASASIEAGPLSVVARHLRRRLRGAPGVRGRAGGRVHVFCHAVPGTWHAMGVMLSAAGSLRWLRDVVAPGVPFDELVAEAARWPPGREGLLFLPYLAGERTPHADPDARGAFVGPRAAARPRRARPRRARGRRLRSARLARAAPRARRRAELGRVSGGGARSELWLEIVASVLGLPLERTAVEEGSAYGAALLAGVAAGVFADAPRRVGVRARAARPDRARTRRGRVAYDERYARYRALYPARQDRGGKMTFEPVRWGIVSTADINRLVIPPAQASPEVDLIAVASRDAKRAADYAAKWAIPRSYGSVRGAPRRPGCRGGLRLAAELDALRMVDPGPPGRQARPLREADVEARRRGRGGLRRGGAGRSTPVGGVHVAP